MKILRHLPNALTCGNLLCGCVGIIWVAQHPNDPMHTAAFFVWTACVFDFLDGFAARALGVTSSIGKELDSLADMVSFGVLPSMVMFTLINVQTNGSLWAYSGFAIAVFSALRLAQFNIATNQSESFIGVPTPATALFITGLAFLPPSIQTLTGGTYALVAMAFLFSLLMVSPWELLALKFKNFTWGDNRLRFTFLLLTVLLLVIWHQGAIPMIIIMYILISLLSRILTSSK